MTAVVSRVSSADTSQLSRARVWSFRSHCGKENHVAYARRSCQIHEQPIHANPYSSHWWHAVFHCAKIILVDTRGLEIAFSLEPCLRFETLPLIDRIIELAECVGQLL